MATGLGSVDATHLVNEWGIVADLPANQTVLTATADKSTILMSGSVNLTIAISASIGASVPGGTVYVNLSNTTTPASTLPGELLLGTATLAPSGRAAATANLRVYGGQLNPGDNTLTITYAGNAQFNGNTATITIHVNLPDHELGGDASSPPAVLPLCLSAGAGRAEFFRESNGRSI